jgi:hypothetical protein
MAVEIIVKSVQMQDVRGNMGNRRYHRRNLFIPARQNVAQQKPRAVARKLRVIGGDADDVGAGAVSGRRDVD